MKLVATLLVLAACGSTTPSTGAPPPSPDPVTPPAVTGPQPPGITPIEDESGTTYQISQGQPGEPAAVGCADGQREAFVDAAQFPTIAGCIAEWEANQSLRAPRTNAACGDDARRCAVPADACAPGWRMCGDAGKLADLTRVTAEQCEQAGGGRFVAALSHCKTQRGCVYESAEIGEYPCFEQGWCSEPVCCGNDCGQMGVCTDGVWRRKTHIPVGMDQGCGAVSSSRARGVLCCKG